MTLPPFTPPTLAELRDWYQRYRENQNVIRLILEVQHGRMTLARMTGLLGRVERAARHADFGRLTNEGAPLLDACGLAWEEMIRAGMVDISQAKAMPPPSSIRGAAAFDYDPDESEDRRIEEVARAIARSRRKR